MKLAIATNRIDAAQRKYWKNLEPIARLKCGITKGKKLDALKEVFYLTPEPTPQVTKEVNAITLTQLREMAKNQGISGYTKKKKQELVDMLSPMFI